jgi:tRNA uridine 5-carbamoylmethylation protein Kti12
MNIINEPCLCLVTREQLEYLFNDEGDVLITSVVTILIGPPCVGKTSYLKNLDYDFVLSSDDVVDILTSRVGIQYHDFFRYPANSEIRKQHNNIFKKLIRESHNFEHVVWDLTNLTKKSRKTILNQYPQAIFNAVVFDFLGNEALLLERNQLRFKQQGKYVDESVIKGMFSSYEPVGDEEGFNHATVIKLS